jgi:hydrogenase/urease accessory protein HupE
VLLDAIAGLAPAGRDPFTDADTLARAVEIGLLDAPHLRGNAAACGKVVTRMVGGACLAVDGPTGHPIPEPRRVSRALGRPVPTGGRGAPRGRALQGTGRP